MPPAGGTPSLPGSSRGAHPPAPAFPVTTDPAMVPWPATLCQYDKEA
jgi:hypothetical protein